MKLRLDFLFTDLSQCFRIYLLVIVLKFFIHRHGVRGDEAICFDKSKVIQPQPKYKTTHFQNLIRKRLLRCQKQIRISNWSHYKHHKAAEFLFCVFFQFNNNLDIVI